MDQASASPAASCAHNPAAPRTSSSCSQSADQSQTVGPPPARSSPRSEPHSEPVHIVPRPSSPALCQSDAKGYLLPDFYSGCATGIPGRLTEGLLLWRSHAVVASCIFLNCWPKRKPSLRHHNQPFNTSRSARFLGIFDKNIQLIVILIVRVHKILHTRFGRMLAPVCTENLTPDVVMMKSAKNRI